jgi:hypothetical protein
MEPLGRESERAAARRSSLDASLLEQLQNALPQAGSGPHDGV